MASVIIFAVSKNIFHRDLKPANIFLTLKGDIKIGDFGFARVAESDGQAGTVLGTPLYQAPEVRPGVESYNYKVDLFSLGTILYEMI